MTKTKNTIQHITKPENERQIIKLEFKDNDLYLNSIFQYYDNEINNVRYIWNAGKIQRMNAIRFNTFIEAMARVAPMNMHSKELKIQHFVYFLNIEIDGMIENKHLFIKNKDIDLSLLSIEWLWDDQKYLLRKRPEFSRWNRKDKGYIFKNLKI